MVGDRAADRPLITARGRVRAWSARVALSLSLLVGLATLPMLTSGCAVGLCCVPLGLAALAASRPAQSDSARVQAQTPPVAAPASPAIALVVEGLPRRGALR